ncbi:hypothetical protein ES703_04834 [subsurface metagenome]
MKPTYLLTVTLLISAAGSTLHAQSDTLWTRTFGGGDQDVGYSVQLTSDGAVYSAATCTGLCQVNQAGVAEIGA